MDALRDFFYLLVVIFGVVGFISLATMAFFCWTRLMGEVFDWMENLW